MPNPAKKSGRAVVVGKNKPADPISLGRGYLPSFRRPVDVSTGAAQASASTKFGAARSSNDLKHVLLESSDVLPDIINKTLKDNGYIQRDLSPRLRKGVQRASVKFHQRLVEKNYPLTEEIFRAFVSKLVTEIIDRNQIDSLVDEVRLDPAPRKPEKRRLESIALPPKPPSAKVGRNPKLSIPAMAAAIVLSVGTLSFPANTSASASTGSLHAGGWGGGSPQDTELVVSIETPGADPALKYLGASSGQTGSSPTLEDFIPPSEWPSRHPTDRNRSNANEERSSNLPSTRPDSPGLDPYGRTESNGLESRTINPPPKEDWTTPYNARSVPDDSFSSPRSPSVSESPSPESRVDNPSPTPREDASRPSGRANSEAVNPGSAGPKVVVATLSLSFDDDFWDAPASPPSESPAPRTSPGRRTYPDAPKTTVPDNNNSAPELPSRPNSRDANPFKRFQRTPPSSPPNVNAPETQRDNGTNLPEARLDFGDLEMEPIPDLGANNRTNRSPSNRNIPNPAPSLSPGALEAIPPATRAGLFKISPFKNSDVAANLNSPDAPNLLPFLTSAAAERNRQTDGTPNPNLYDHTDPGNNKGNVGSLSCNGETCAGMNVQEADEFKRKEFAGFVDRFKQAAQKAGLDPNDPYLFASYYDICTQAGADGCNGEKGFIDRLSTLAVAGPKAQNFKQVRLLVLRNRILSYINPAKNNKLDIGGFDDIQRYATVPEDREYRILYYSILDEMKKNGNEYNEDTYRKFFDDQVARDNLIVEVLERWDRGESFAKIPTASGAATASRPKPPTAPSAQPRPDANRSLETKRPAPQAPSTGKIQPGDIPNAVDAPPLLTSWDIGLPVAKENYQVTDTYRMRETHPASGKQNVFHQGLDIGGPVGTPILAVANGVVFYSQWNEGGYGYLIGILHNVNGNYVMSLYAHNSELVAPVGTQVKRGDVIAKMGSTGLSTGPHSHFEVRTSWRDDKKYSLDPEIALKSGINVALQQAGHQVANNTPETNREGAG